ncbi:glucuronate isomerase [Paenibacillus sp. V4I3]|uniref:hypothetical protein n=1 Tax=Paenibacillus sp. V4I3 TaxID=3042305 RepID=UPI002786B996|nr:hypothetical protein [Paenibacillus sp. V4I3]MDQ0876139.1 glucuronate isomerase [Paenibacillus sp. V4I3]
MVKLVFPVVISLLLSLFYSVKLNKNHKLATIISIATVINIFCLLLGTVWWWVTETDGLGQVMQIIIYAICLGVILLINVTAVIVVKKRRM